MLNAAQLHYLLEHYKLSVPHPDHWTPLEPDKEEAENLGTSYDLFIYFIYSLSFKTCYRTTSRTSRHLQFPVRITT